MTCSICNGQLVNEPLLVITIPDRFEEYIGVDLASFKRTWHKCSMCSVVQAIHYDYRDKKIEQIADKYFKIDFGNTTSKSRFDKIMRLPNENSDNFYRVRRVKDFFSRWIVNFDFNASCSILDIGGGLGVFLAKFLEFNSEFSGVMIEPDKNSTNHIDETYPFEFHSLLFSGQEEFKRDFDIVCLNKVVEHIDKPHQLLSDIQKALNKISGLLYIEIPDELNINHRPASDNSLGSLHHHLYNVQSLNYLLENTGYSVLQMERILEPSGKISIYAFATSKSAVNKWLSL